MESLISAGAHDRAILQIRHIHIEPPTDAIARMARFHSQEKIDVIFPRFGMRKKTRSVLSGVMIAVASLFALGYAYEEARINMMRFFVGTIVMVLVVLLCAALAVTVLTLLRKLFKMLRGKSDDGSNDAPPT